jgi:ubiquinone/menaquinone biosynthesis C-methylase UbiE
MLDVDLYDQQKAFTAGRSDALFSRLKQVAGLSDHLGDLLEVGAGTGLLTIGMLANSTFDRALITDISPEMLEVCRARVRDALPHRPGIEFATYEAGTGPVPDRFDMCIGNSVLHHILDYRSFLAEVRRSLKPGGMAVFWEPNAVFLDALARSIADALCNMIAWQGLSVDENVLALTRLVTDIRIRLSGPDNVAELEDKYIFTRETLVDDGRGAGFSRTEVLPDSFDRDGIDNMINSARELKLSDSFLDSFSVSYRRHAHQHFRNVAREDLCGMYICKFQV